MAQSQIITGDQVLLIATPSLHTNDEMTSARQELVNTVGSNGRVGFEVFDRIEEAPIKASSYTYVISTQTPNIHPPATLQKLLTILQPGGTLHILEPVILPSAPSIIGSQLTRTTADLLSSLKLSGFIDSTVVSETVASDDMVQSHAVAWGLPNSYVPDMKGGKVILTEVVAKKPKYEVGQKFALSFTKNTSASRPATTKKSVWTLSLQDNDEDADLVDEDELLDEVDRIKPSKDSLTRPDDCEMPAGSRKACKNCSCGRAEQLAASPAIMLDLDDDLVNPEIISVDPNPKKSSCGSCSLGDAFRCSTCPFLGMPSFKPGDEVKLMQNGWGRDDLVGF